MNTKKPERPSCSNLSERQWKNILEQFEYEWDMKCGQGPNFKDALQIEHKRDIETLASLSLICPAEVEILVKYDTECHTEFIDKIDAFFKALADRVIFKIPDSDVYKEEKNDHE